MSYRALEHLTYREYLETDHWKWIRFAALWVAGNRCQLCRREDITWKFIITITIVYSMNGQRIWLSSAGSVMKSIALLTRWETIRDALGYR